VPDTHPGGDKPFPATALLNNSFNISAGETVVVGTSRLHGDRALIVLVTAVAAGK
jgi:hypothetical protein